MNPSFPANDGSDQAWNPNANFVYPSPSQQQQPQQFGYSSPEPAPASMDWNQGQEHQARHRPVATTPPERSSSPNLEWLNSVESAMGSKLAQNPVASLGFQMGRDFVEKRIGGVYSWLRLHNLKYYFAVNNSYVLKKMKILLCPFVHKKWARKHGLHSHDTPESASASHPSLPQPTPDYPFRVPMHDVNAPDLYLPMMALITYTLLIAFLHGTNGKFTPEVFNKTAWLAFITIIMEVVLFKVGMWLMGIGGNNASGLHLVDMMAYAGYKYVNVIISVLLGSMFGSLISWVAFLYLAACNGFFMIRTLARALSPTVVTDPASMPSDNASNAPQVSQSTRTYFLLIIGGFEMLLMFFLARD